MAEFSRATILRSKLKRHKLPAFNRKTDGFKSLRAHQFMQCEFRYNGQLFNLPWMWAEILPACQRFMNQDGERCTFDDSILRYYIQEEWKRDVQRELVDPEWPCQYWEEKTDLMDY